VEELEPQNLSLPTPRRNSSHYEQQLLDRISTYKSKRFNLRKIGDVIIGDF
jgi:hypothetical protein